LQNGFRFGFARQFAVINFIRPIAELAWSFYSLQDIRPPEPPPVFQRGLNNNRVSTFHRGARFSKRSPIVIDIAHIDNAESFGCEKAEICFFVLKSTLLQHPEVRRFPARWISFAKSHAQVQRREMVTR